MPDPYVPEIQITCIGYWDRLILEDAIMDSIESFQSEIKSMNRRRFDDELGLTPNVVAMCEKRIKELEAMRKVLVNAPVCHIQE